MAGWKSSSTFCDWEQISLEEFTKGVAKHKNLVVHRAWAGTARRAKSEDRLNPGINSPSSLLSIKLNMRATAAALASSCRRNSSTLKRGRNNDYMIRARHASEAFPK